MRVRNETSHPADRSADRAELAGNVTEVLGQGRSGQRRGPPGRAHPPGRCRRSVEKLSRRRDHLRAGRQPAPAPRRRAHPLRQGHLHAKRIDARLRGIVPDLRLQDARSLPRTMDDLTAQVAFRAMMENTNDFIYFKDRNYVFHRGKPDAGEHLRPGRTLERPAQGPTTTFLEAYADLYYRLEEAGFPARRSPTRSRKSLPRMGTQAGAARTAYPVFDASRVLVGLFGVARATSPTASSPSRNNVAPTARCVCSGECNLALVNVESEAQLFADIRRLARRDRRLRPGLDRLR